MIGWQLSRTIIEIPWLHDMIAYTFLLLLTLYVLGFIHGLYKITRFTKEKRKEWSFEGKPWSYWKQYK